MIRLPQSPQQSPERLASGSAPLHTFRLTRYFSMGSLVGVLVVLGVLLLVYRQFSLDALVEQQTHNNANITRLFTASAWPAYAAYIYTTATLPASALAQSAETARVKEEILRLTNGTMVVHVKLFNLQGVTVFSTDARQIGEARGTSSGFLAAKSGVAEGALVTKDQIDVLRQAAQRGTLVSTYVPIRKSVNAPVEGVMEIYADVTPYIEQLRKSTFQFAAWAIACFAVLYLFLLSIIRRAEGVLREQSNEVDAAHEALLNHNTLHDGLTGLPNRVNFSERLNETIQLAKSANEKAAVFFLDIDRFKNINDSLGHLAGDQILKEVTNRLKSCLRGSDVVARIGGDEFAIIPSEGTGARGVERIINTVERLRAAISGSPVMVGAHSVTINTSIGIALYPDDGADAVELIKNADIAVDHAKKMGRNNYQFHRSDMNARALDMLVMEHGLRRALEENQFVLHYQPQVDLKTGLVVGVEALMRWQHPEHGLISPSQFIPLAEERGLIVPIGSWAVREACRQNLEWQAAGLPRITVAVNISASHFQQKHFSEEVSTILLDSGLAPKYLDLELTESSIMLDTETTISVMGQLKRIGLKLSLDDFGTGHSSLSQLKRLPFDKVKLDQTFVRGLPNDPDDVAIATAILGMGKALKLRVVAEGVETEGQLAFLRTGLCDQIQGLVVSKPLTGAEFVQFMRAQPGASNASLEGVFA